MSRQPSDKTKHIRGMGTGTGANYKAYIKTREFNSLGTTSMLTDWKTGREVNCLSQGEAIYYRLLRWDDDNLDVREQFPLDNKETVSIAHKLGIKHPKDEKYIMTTDFIVNRNDGSMHAYAVESNRDLSKRTLQILCIEKTYWLSHGCKFHILYKSEANRILDTNIRLVTEFYDADKVFDIYSMLKHLIAVKKLVVDMENEVLTNDVLNRHKERVIWKK